MRPDDRLVREKLRAVLAGSTAGQPARSPEEQFAAADSIARFEAVLAVEGAFECALPDAALARVRTFDDLTVLVTTTLAAPAVPAESPVTRRESLPPAPEARWGSRGATALAGWTRAWFRVSVRGAENLPPAGEAGLLCANHTSHLDGLALLAAAGPARDRLVFAAAKDYFFKRPRLAAWFTGALPVIPWERGGDLAAMRENLRHLAACRAAGRLVVFFPEGGRSRDGTLQPFKEGLEFFAAQLGLPVVPAWIDGAHRALPKGAAFPRPGQLAITFGPPVREGEPGTTLAATVRRRMLALKDLAA